jgi:hypothetical protein
MKRFCILLLPLLLAAGPCGHPITQGHATHDPGAGETESLARALRSAGLQVKSADPIRQPFFTTAGHVLLVEGDDLQVYEYPSRESASADAAKIAPSGSPIGTSMPNWMRPPHIFRKDKLIMIYLGAASRVLTALEAYSGPQLAGAK